MLYHKVVNRTYYCPKCKSVLKYERDNYGNDGCVMFLAYIVILPFWLIYKGIKLIVNKLSKKKISNYEPSITYLGKNVLGENVYRCNQCKSMVVFNMLGTMIVTEDEIVQ